MTETRRNIDPEEIAKFEDLAARWWDPLGSFRPLHELNPLRLGFIDDKTTLSGKRVLDVGCGGGILAESMAQRGAVVTGIDAGRAPLDVARLHQMESGVSVEYQQITAEEMASQAGHAFDVVTCMELLEHVPEPHSVVQACADLCRPGGHVFFSTINRNPKAYLLAVIGAEYVLRMLPAGTHDYEKFIRPSELDAWGRQAGLVLNELAGVAYNPLSGRYRLCRDVAVNYMAWMRPAVDS